MFFQLHWLLPRSILKPLLNLSHDLNFNAINFQCSKVRTDSLGSRESHFPDHTLGKTSLNLVSPCLISLNIDIMRLNRYTLERKAEAACYHPVYIGVFQSNVYLAENVEINRINHILIERGQSLSSLH